MGHYSLQEIFLKSFSGPKILIKPFLLKYSPGFKISFFEIELVLAELQHKEVILLMSSIPYCVESTGELNSFSANVLIFNLTSTGQIFLKIISQHVYYIYTCCEIV